MSGSYLFWGVATVVCLAGGAMTLNAGWFVALIYCLWRWDHAGIDDQLKEIKERLDK